MKDRLLHLTLIILLALSLTAVYCIQPVGALTWVEGHLTSDTTWVPTETYRVIEDTYVDSGATLTIMPGVRVEFVDGLSLKIEGSLNASGTITEPIIFTSSRTQPSPGVWAGLEFRANASEHLRLENSRIEYADYGIVINSQAEGIIANNEFTNNSQSGIHIDGDSNTTIISNTFSFNKDGITSDEATVSHLRIMNNTLAQNLGEGIYIQASSTNVSRLSDIEITGNAVTNNALNGIGLNSLAQSDAPYDYECYGYIENVIVSENVVTSNGQDGININAEGRCKEYLDEVRYGYAFINNLTLTNNTVASNGGNGIYVHSKGYGFYGESYGNIQNMLVVSNNGTGNGNNGIEICSEGITDGSRASGGRGVIVNVTVANNRFSSNNGDGVQLCSKGQADVISTSSMTASTLTQNEASSNGGNGISLLTESQGSRGGDASITSITISDNEALSNEQNGFVVQPQTREQATVQDIQFLDDQACLNGENGILIAPICRRFLVENVNFEKTITLLNIESGVIIFHIPVHLPSFPHPPTYEGFVENITLSNCAASRNGERGFSIEPDSAYHDSLQYVNGALEEITILNSTIIGNDVGIFICPTVPSIQGQRLNMTYNLVRDNKLGAEIKDEQGNSAHFNDILGNNHGMNVTGTATAEAENNYWGDDSGPYHYSVNPSGKGNSVNGNGTDLQFIPFLGSPATTPYPLPTALLSLNNTVHTNDVVKIDASNSTGDGGIRFLYFDFGDGTHTNWTTELITTHRYTSAGTYNVTLNVMDMHGSASQNSSLILVQTEAIPEIPLMFVLPFFAFATVFAATLLRRKRFG
jgi:parallel beta-helix repeat protein